MSDRFSVEFEIGGTIKKVVWVDDVLTSIWDLIAAAACEDSFSTEWDSVIPREKLAEDLKAEADHGFPLTLTGQDINWGNADELERVCKEFKIAYIRRVHGLFEYNGEIHWGNLPGKEDGSYEVMDQTAQHPQISVDLLRRDWKGRSVDELVEFLDSLPSDLPPLVLV